MRRGAVRWEGKTYLYQPTRDNRRSYRTAPSDCLFGFNGVDEAVRERSSTSGKDGTPRPKTCSMAENKTSIKLEVKRFGRQ